MATSSFWASSGQVWARSRRFRRSLAAMDPTISGGGWLSNRLEPTASVRTPARAARAAVARSRTAAPSRN
jgi:hypothetical protein